MNVKSNKGFSLIELMVVVAIIGILATVAVPNFMKFQAKAKQSSAKVELSAIYTAEKAFYTEYSSYHGYLPYVGYVPDGCTDAAVCTGGTRYYQTGFGAAGIIAPFGGAAVTGKTTSSFPASVAVATALPGSTTTTAAAFTAGANGTIATNAGNPTDIWTMTSNKLLSNPTPGF